MRAGGPNIDFILGRTWEGAVESALEPIIIERNLEYRKLSAKNEYHKKNCDLIGR